MTQNVNKSFNNAIWQRCPKAVYLERSTLVHGVYSVIISFNKGNQRPLKVFQSLGLSPGNLMTDYVNSADASRVKRSGYKASDEFKSLRQDVRAVRKGWTERNRELEGDESYLKAGFH